MSKADAIRALLSERPGLTYAEIKSAIPGAGGQLRQMVVHGQLTHRGPAGKHTYYALTEEEEAAREARKSKRSPRPNKTFEYVDLFSVDMSEVNEYADRGWRAVSATCTSSGWTVLMERPRRMA